MTITSVYTPAQFLGSGSTGPFTFNFRVLSKNHLTVIKVAEDGTETTLTEGVGASQYSIELTSGGVQGGQITLVTALAVGERLVISRSTPRTQPTRYANQGEFFGETHETSYDRDMMVVQEVEARVDKSVQGPVSDPTDIDYTLPNAETRASKMMAFDEDGNVTVSNKSVADIESGSTDAQNWATKTDGAVSGGEYSAKAYALGGTGVTNTAGKGAAKEWATKTGGTVDGTEYSAKHYSQLTAADRIATAADVVTTNNNVTTTNNNVTSAQTAQTAAEAAAAGMKWRPSCRAATTANITLSGAQTIDGVSVVAGDRVLVKNQSTASQNGVYVAASGAWSRATDADTWAELIGMAVVIEEGSTLADQLWICTVNSGGTIGSTSVTFENIGFVADGSITFTKLASAAIASQSDATTGTATNVLMTPQRVRQAINNDYEVMSFIIGQAANQDYRFVINHPHAGTIDQVTTRSLSGTCTLTMKINTTAMGGTANSVSTTEQSQSHASSNTFAAGDDIVGTVSGNSAALGVTVTIRYKRT